MCSASLSFALPNMQSGECQTVCGKPANMHPQSGAIIWYDLHGMTSCGGGVYQSRSAGRIGLEEPDHFACVDDFFRVRDSTLSVMT